ncbi:hypothetical protein MMC18_002496, partial [Xylographa bjoerkii]|nr:hypothetical protein [Xylographa bjoerkii]
HIGDCKDGWEQLAHDLADIASLEEAHLKIAFTSREQANFRVKTENAHSVSLCGEEEMGLAMKLIILNKIPYQVYNKLGWKDIRKDIEAQVSDPRTTYFLATLTLELLEITGVQSTSLTTLQLPSVFASDDVPTPSKVVTLIFPMDYDFHASFEGTGVGGTSGYGKKIQITGLVKAPWIAGVVE